MSYTYNKPDSGDTISSSQAVLKNNFTAIKTLVDVNHVTFDLTDQGKHTYVTMPQQTSLPTISATEWSFFSASDGTNTQLYLRTSSTGAIDLTKDRAITSALKADPGWCMLPCGIIMKWASGSVTSGSSATISLANGAGIPDITTMLSVSVTPGYGSSPEGNVFYSSYTNTSGANAVTVRCWKPFSGSITLSAYVLVLGV